MRMIIAYIVPTIVHNIVITLIIINALIIIAEYSQIANHEFLRD